MARDPSIEGHVELEIKSNGVLKIDKVLGSVGFLAQDKDYLQTEHLYVCIHL